MKIGMNLLLWTTHVTEAHLPLVERLKAKGYDGIEVPLFEGPPDHYALLGRRLDAIGMERTALSVIPEARQNPIAADPSDRARGLAHLDWCLTAAAALGAPLLSGPFTQALGVFSGAAPTAGEIDRAVEFHHAVGARAKAAGVTVALEALNRFEVYLINTCADLAAHADRVAHPNIRAMYDTFHAHIEEDEPAAGIAALGPRIANVHVSENTRGTPGRGQVDFLAAFRALKLQGHGGWLTIEACGRALPELAAATRIWRDVSRSSDDIWQTGFDTIRDTWAAA